MNAPPVTNEVTPTAARVQDPLHVYAHLQERARSAATLPELLFSLANETWQLFPYQQSFIWRAGIAKTPAIRCISGVAQVAEDSPLTLWLTSLGRWLATIDAQAQPDASAQVEGKSVHDPFFVTGDELPESLRAGWEEWIGRYLFVQPVLAPDGQRLGLIAFSLDDVPDERVQALALRSIAAYGHAWAVFAPPTTRARKWRSGGWIIAAMLLASLFIPVRLSVLAPAEIVGLAAQSVSAPMDGVIESFSVAPNQTVQRDQLLFTLDATTLRNRREVALRQLEIARADALAAQQKAFANDASRAELTVLEGRVAEKQAELVYVEDQLARIEVRAPADGVVVFGDVNDWQGKPVSTGERIALLADPSDAGVLVWLAVPDAINLEQGAPVQLYLDVAPLVPLLASLFESSYQAVASPLGVQSYRVRARFESLDEAQRELVRIGLAGTAKIKGERAALGYYLMRRPLAGLRRFLGV